MKCVIYAVALIILVFYSCLDFKYKEISMCFLYAGIAVMFAFGIVLRMLLRQDIVGYIIVSLAVFSIICAAEKALEKWIGGADFDVMYMIYLIVGVQNMIIFSFFVLIICVAVLGLPAVRKSYRDKRIPLIPVLTAAYVMTIIMGGGVY